MKPGLFEYVAPSSIDEVIAELATNHTARPIAGGQSLVPALNFRFANPGKLVDLRKLDELRGIQILGDAIRVGAMTRHRELELDDAVYKANPLIRQVLGNVSHITVRNRGTIGGNIAHADSASELPAFLLVMEGFIETAGPDGKRVIQASDFFKFHMTTALADREIVTNVVIPVMPSGHAGCFKEFNRRKGDYAVAGVVSVIARDTSGCCTSARLAACGVATTAVRLTEAENLLIGSDLDRTVIAKAAAAAREYVKAPDDLIASSNLRKQITATLVTRTINEAASAAPRG